MSILQIDVTNICNRECSNCTRMIGHFKKEQEYFMDVEYFEMAVKSLRNFDGMIGFIGGEPTLHPEFETLCTILNKYISDKRRKGLWTYTNPESSQYSKIISETFGFLSVNEKNVKAYHTPILASSKELIPNEEVRKKYIENCWIQNYWSGTINPKGGWFCEVAGAFSILMDGPEGKDISDPDWWDKSISEFKDQIDWACLKCGASIPLEPRLDIENIDDLSSDNFEILKEQSNKIKRGRIKIFQGEIDPCQKRDCSWYRNYKK